MSSSSLLCISPLPLGWRMQPCHCFVMLWVYKCLVPRCAHKFGQMGQILACRAEFLCCLRSRPYLEVAGRDGAPGRRLCLFFQKWLLLFLARHVLFLNFCSIFSNKISTFSNKISIVRTPSYWPCFVFPRSPRPFFCTMVTLVRSVSFQGCSIWRFQFSLCSIFSNIC